ncbi:GAF and ANTAR domain-containing protein [Nocardia sp. CDC159]|uniref:GAF and ANTAR domain-containing protein n=1 Tax=Nocardia pulmonis TaxID=2951408 RepID=A0A9X2E7S1_9NOCA|nr:MULTISPECIES: GAF and ANTAR domain-containing protein [Nocardia]MCM6775324.1 GAF and ANTAR domain-containing protein [Nocardia pulmonis]MCM6787942.1 GAF and ANTAR domain-containing protein [Nocardia sp. CDC159]
MTRFEQLSDRFLTALKAGRGGVAGACHACVHVLPVQRAAIVIDEHHAGVQPWYSSDAMAAGVEAVQATVGEGPAVDAVATGRPVPVSDLAGPGDRWPGFADALADTDASGAMFAIPLQLGAIRFGALDLYRDTPGEPDASIMSASLHIADLITDQLIRARTRRSTPAAIHPDDLLWLEQPLASRAIHQAAGMVVAQSNIAVPDAYARLRAYAFGHGMSLAEVSRAVIARRIRFEAD